MRFCRFVFMFFCFLVGNSAAYAQLKLHHDKIKDLQVLFISGTFPPDYDVRQLHNTLATRSVDVVIFDSEGGNPASAMAVGRVLRRHDVTTLQTRDFECASACAFAFIGGAVRLAQPGSIGIHQVHFSDDSGLDTNVAVWASQKFQVELWDYVEEMGVSSELVKLAMSIEPADMEYLNGEQMRELRVTSANADAGSSAQNEPLGRDRPARKSARLTTPPSTPSTNSTTNPSFQTETGTSRSSNFGNSPSPVLNATAPFQVFASRGKYSRNATVNGTATWSTQSIYRPTSTGARVSNSLKVEGTVQLDSSTGSFEIVFYEENRNAYASLKLITETLRGQDGFQGIGDLMIKSAPTGQGRPLRLPVENISRAPAAFRFQLPSDALTAIKNGNWIEVPLFYGRSSLVMLRINKQGQAAQLFASTLLSWGYSDARGLSGSAIQ